MAILTGLVAAALWAIGLANCWFALHAPFELEVREGTVWLYVLAQDAGQSLYDHTRVAFLNMNHGPLEPVFKAWIHRALPILPSYVVTRAFVALLPLALFILFWRGLRRPGLAALWAGGTYLFLLGLGPFQFLIGRSDPTAVVFFCALMATADRRLRDDAASSVARALVWGAWIGGLGAATVLLNWRYAPAVAAVAVLACVDDGMCSRGQTRGRMAASAGGGLVCAGAVFLVVVYTQFHGDLLLYYRHFFGVFTHASGWGARGRMPFELFPDELSDGRLLVHLGLVLGLVGVWRTNCSHPPSWWRNVSWLVVMTSLWCVTAWGFFYNHGAGGLYYFAPFYLMLAYQVATRASRANSAPRWLTLATALLLLAGLPWQTTVVQVRQLAEAGRAGREFGQRLKSVTANDYVYSEDLHLFRRQYAGEVIDVGDMVTEVAATGFMGGSFRQTVNDHWAALLQSPPPFVLVGAKSVVSPELRRLLETRYISVMRSGPVILAQGGLPITLYRLEPNPARPR